MAGDLLPPSPGPGLSQVCARETGERDQETKQECRMGVGGCWILALFEIFFRQVWDIYRRKAAVFFLFLYSP